MGKTEDKIEKYIAVIKNQLDVELIVIFGSYLTDRFSAESDIDMLIVASEFSKMSKLEAFKILSKPIWDLRINVDPIPAAPAEMKDYKRASFLYQIMNTGRVLYPKSA